MEGMKPSSYKKNEVTAYIRSPPRSISTTVTNTTPSKPMLSPTTEERRTDSNRTREDRLSSLKAYRKAKGGL